MTKNGVCKRRFKPGKEMLEEFFSFFPLSDIVTQKQKIQGLPTGVGPITSSDAPPLAKKTQRLRNGMFAPSKIGFYSRQGLKTSTDL